MPTKTTLLLKSLNEGLRRNSPASRPSITSIVSPRLKLTRYAPQVSLKSSSLINVKAPPAAQQPAADAQFGKQKVKDKRTMRLEKIQKIELELDIADVQ